MIKKKLKALSKEKRLKLLKLRLAQKNQPKEENVDVEGVLKKIIQKKTKHRVKIIDDEKGEEISNALKSKPKKKKKKKKKEKKKKAVKEDKDSDPFKFKKKTNMMVIQDSGDEGNMEIEEVEDDEIMFVSAEQDFQNVIHGFPSSEEEEVPEEEQIPEIQLEKEFKDYTISISFPDSIIQKCQSFDLRNFMISQLARTAAINMVDEIVLIKDQSFTHRNKEFGSIESVAKILQYLETPQYLRKALFPISKDLKYVGLMNPIESSHHLLINEYCPYREGVTLNRPTKMGDGSWVEIGLYKQLKLNKKIVPGTRVTVKINEEYQNPNIRVKCNFEKKLNFFKDWTGDAVAPTEPKKKLGLYWGYQVRFVEYFSALFKTCPYPEGYQIKILVDGIHGEPFNSEKKQEILTTLKKKEIT